MKKFEYKNKTAIVTGASSGIGKEIARSLVLEYGCTVYGIARGDGKLQELKKELGENFAPYPMDVSLKENWGNLKEFLKKTNTSPDILINCAGCLPEFASLQNTETDTVENVMNVNFFSCVYACCELLPIISRGGIIANVSSASALCPFAGVSAYSASKSALERFTECISCENKEVSILTVMPGFVKTDIMKNQNMSEKDRGIVSLFSADLDKTVKKLLKCIRKRKKRIILGTDAHFMSAMYRLFPNLTPKLISRIIKKSELELFSKI